MTIKTIDELKDMFFEACDEIYTEDMVSIHNKYCEANGYDDDMVYKNNDLFFEEYLSGCGGIDLLSKAQHGDYSVGHDYVWLDGYANLCSSDFERDMPIDKYAIFEEALENTRLLEGYEAFDDFVEAVEEYQNGEDEEDEE